MSTLLLVFSSTGIPGLEWIHKYATEALQNFSRVGSHFERTATRASASGEPAQVIIEASKNATVIFIHRWHFTNDQDQSVLDESEENLGPHFKAKRVTAEYAQKIGKPSFHRVPYTYIVGKTSQLQRDNLINHGDSKTLDDPVEKVFNSMDTIPLHTGDRHTFYTQRPDGTIWAFGEINIRDMNLIINDCVLIEQQLDVIANLGKIHPMSYVHGAKNAGFALREDFKGLFDEKQVGLASFMPILHWARKHPNVASFTITFLLSLIYFLVVNLIEKDVPEARAFFRQVSSEQVRKHCIPVYTNKSASIKGMCDVLTKVRWTRNGKNISGWLMTKHCLDLYSDSHLRVEDGGVVKIIPLKNPVDIGNDLVFYSASDVVVPGTTPLTRIIPPSVSSILFLTYNPTTVEPMVGYSMASKNETAQRMEYDCDSENYQCGSAVVDASDLNKVFAIHTGTNTKVNFATLIPDLPDFIWQKAHPPAPVEIKLVEAKAQHQRSRGLEIERPSLLPQHHEVTVPQKLKVRDIPDVGEPNEPMDDDLRLELLAEQGTEEEMTYDQWHALLFGHLGIPTDADLDCDEARSRNKGQNLKHANRREQQLRSADYKRTEEEYSRHMENLENRRTAIGEELEDLYEKIQHDSRHVHKSTLDRRDELHDELEHLNEDLRAYDDERANPEDVIGAYSREDLKEWSKWLFENQERLKQKNSAIFEHHLENLEKQWAAWYNGAAQEARSSQVLLCQEKALDEVEQLLHSMHSMTATVSQTEPIRVQGKKEPLSPSLEKNKRMTKAVVIPEVQLTAPVIPPSTKNAGGCTGSVTSQTNAVSKKVVTLKSGDTLTSESTFPKTLLNPPQEKVLTNSANLPSNKESQSPTSRTQKRKQRLRQLTMQQKQSDNHSIKPLEGQSNGKKP